MHPKSLKFVHGSDNYSCKQPHNKYTIYNKSNLSVLFTISTVILENHKEKTKKRKGSKAMVLINHTKLGLCVLLVQERSDNQRSLPGGQLSVGETHEQGLARELKEETNLTARQKKYIVTVSGKRDIREIFAVQAIGTILLCRKELQDALAFYPLNDTIIAKSIRQKLQSHMHGHAIKGIEYFRQTNTWETYNASSISYRNKGNKYFNNFHTRVKQN